MNERIKELADQAGIVLWQSHLGSITHYEGRIETLEKFAELIIKECSTHLRNCANAYDGSDTDADYMEAMLHSTDMIKEHFGVE